MYFPRKYNYIPLQKRVFDFSAPLPLPPQSTSLFHTFQQKSLALIQGEYGYFLVPQNTGTYSISVLDISVYINEVYVQFTFDLFTHDSLHSLVLLAL